MQNVAQVSTSDKQSLDKVNCLDLGKSSTPLLSNNIPNISGTESFSELQPLYVSDSSESEEEDVSEVESFVIDQEELVNNRSKYLLNSDDSDTVVDAETQARLEALLEAAGIGKLSTTGDGKHLADPEVLRRLTSSVSCALDEAAAALTRMRSERASVAETRTLVEACSDGDVGAVRKLLGEGRSVNETNEEGESLLSLACSAGYYELAQVLLAMHANVEDRGVKGDCTPLMEAASAGFVDIVRLLIAHGADVNAQSSSGNTPLMYACAGGHELVVRELLEAGANVEDHNENGHTPLMEAASAGYVEVAKILLNHGAGINTHSNEFKESALTLACYKGHLAMVRFLLDAGADQEHKTDEMHTALMEASMDGHVEVAKLLLDSGAQVNMPTDSFESPLTLAACGGHVDLALLLIDRGANIEEVNDEGYTPLMEAAREGHKDMVSVLLQRGANINAQTEETQETALTLACCGGFLEVADYLIKNGAALELGASTPLMEAAQEGHIHLVKYLLDAGADVHAQTQTGDTALTYACENGHTDVADLLLQYRANLEHESEGGRTPLMKACRAGHVCTVRFLISKNADVNRQTSNNDHTPLSLASAGGHLAVVELLLAQNADPFHKLKDNSTMLIEAAKGGHVSVVQLLLDYPHSIMVANQAQLQAEQLQAQAQAETQPSQVFVPAQTQTQAQIHIPQLQTQPQLPLQTFVHNEQSTQTQIQMPLQPLTHLPSPSSLPQQLLQDDNDSQLSTSVAQLQILNQFQLPAQSHQTVITEEMLGKKSAAIDRLTPTLKISSNNNNNSSSNNNNSSNSNNSSNNNNNNLHLRSNNSPSSGSNNMLTQGQKSFSRKCFVDSSNESVLENQSCSMNSGDLSKKNEYTVVDKNSSKMNVTIEQQLFHRQQIVDELQQSTAISDRPKAKPVSKKDCKNSRKQQQLLVAAQLSKRAGFLAGIKTGLQIGFKSHVQSQDPNYNLRVKHFDQINDQVQELIEQSNSASNQVVISEKEMYDHNQLMAKLQQLDSSLTADPNVKMLPADVVSSSLSQVYCQQLLSDEAESVAVKEKIKIKSEELETLDTLTCDDLALATSDVASHYQLATSQFSSGKDENILASRTPLPIFPSEQETVQLINVPSADQIQSGNTSFEVQYQVTQKGIHQLNNFQADSFRDGQEFYSHLMQTPTALSKTTQVVTQPTTTAVTTQHVQAATQTMPDSTKLKHSVPSNSTRHINASSASTTTGPSATGKGKKLRNQAQNRQNHNHSSISADSKAGFASGGKEDSRREETKPPSVIDVDSETDSNHDTALTLACAGGYDELVELLLSRGADIEHRDKKGFTPLILAATAGHEKVVEALLNHSADMEAQSERTKDTPLSLACSGGRYEVVEILLARGANKEHRNVSDYTPLSLAASGGYVNIIKLLLSHGAEINSRTGSKLGISPLMLAAMNGHTAAVKLLLDMGSDINAQIETNRNTALTLACFQGRHEVVSLLLDRKANVEHRAKTGLTPLMEAASGGYVEVGRVLLSKGADVNASPVPSSRDTALTIAADKGHYRFVELLISSRCIQVEVKNKKGNSPLWLAANGGHLPVVELLYNVGADIDSQDNRKVSCLMAAFRKGHVKVVKWMVNHVTQFPSDIEMTRYISTVNDQELLNKCNECVKIITIAKDQQAAKANKNASILLEELHMERSKEESKKQAAAKKRDRKKQKKRDKKESKKFVAENAKNERYSEDPDEEEIEEEYEEEDEEEEEEEEEEQEPPSEEDFLKLTNKKNRETSSNKKGGNLVQRKAYRGTEVEEAGDSGIDATSQGSCSSNEVAKQSKEHSRKEKKKKGKGNSDANSAISSSNILVDRKVSASPLNKKEKEEKKGPIPQSVIVNSKTSENVSKSKQDSNSKSNKPAKNSLDSFSSINSCHQANAERRPKAHQALVFEASRNFTRDNLDTNANENFLVGAKKKKSTNSNNHSSSSINQSNYMSYYEEELLGGKAPGSNKLVKQRGEEGWKEVVRKYLNSPFRSKKVSVPPNAISRVIGRGGSNINTIRTTTGAFIEIEKQSKGQGERIITIKGSMESTKQAQNLIQALITDPELDLVQMLPKTAKTLATAWPEKTPATNKTKIAVVSKTTTGSSQAQSLQNVSTSTSVSTSQVLNVSSSTTLTGSRNLVSSSPLPTTPASPRQVATGAEKRNADCVTASNTKTTMLYTTAIISSGRTTKTTATHTQTTVTTTFAAKLSSEPNARSDSVIPVTSNSQVPKSQPSIPPSTTSSKTVPGIGRPISLVTPMPVLPPQQPQVAQQQQAKQQQRQQQAVQQQGQQQAVQQQGQQQAVQQQGQQPVVQQQGQQPAVQQQVQHHQQQIVQQPQPVQQQHQQVLLQQQQQMHHLQQQQLQQQQQQNHHHHHHRHHLQQQHHQQQLQQSMQQQTQTAPPQHAVTNSGSSPGGTLSCPPEYSLFNDSFSKVTQKSMWGRDDENANQRCMNFATAAAAGASNCSAPGQSSIGPAPRFLDATPPQVDASKAPGYRGSMSVSSPVLQSKSAPPPPPPCIDHSPPPPPLPTSYANLIPEPSPSQIQAPNITVRSESNYSSRPTYSDDFAQQDSPTSLLKMVSLNDTNFYHTNYSQPETAVSMSRLNPRAPDFSSVKQSLPPAPLQQPLYNQPPPPNNYLPQPLPSTVLNSNVVSFSVNKYLQQSQQPRLNGQASWPFVAGPRYVGPQQEHLTSLASLNPSQSDVFTGLENGNINLSSSMTPPHVSPQGIVEDRKAPPRPIGTERAWKMAGCDSQPEWTLDQKLAWNPIVERQQQSYRSASQYSRISVTEEIQPIVDNSIPGVVGDAGHFNGTSALPLSVMHSMPPLTHFASLDTSNLVCPTDPVIKSVEPSWDPRLICLPEIPDKQQSLIILTNHSKMQ